MRGPVTFGGKAPRPHNENGNVSAFPKPELKTLSGDPIPFETIEDIQKVLDRCRDGELHAIALAAVGQRGDQLTYIKYAWFGDNALGALLGSIVILKDVILNDFYEDAVVQEPFSPDDEPA